MECNRTPYLNHFSSHLCSIITATLDITPDDPRWIGAWWGGFIICGLFLFVSSFFMFGFPQSLNEPGEDPRGESEQAMLPAELVQEYEGVKTSDGPDIYSGLTCCQHLQGEREDERKKCTDAVKHKLI